MKFSSSQAGYITGLRFYKQANNTGRPRRPSVDCRRPAARRGHVHRRERVGLAGGVAHHAGRDHGEHGPTSSPTTRARAASPTRRRTSRPRSRRPPLTAPATGNGVYRYGALGLPRPRPGTRRTTGSTSTFEQTRGRPDRAEGRARRPRPRTRPASARSPRSPRRSTRRSTPRPSRARRSRSADAVRHRRARLRRLRRGHAQGDAHAVGRARLRHDLHRDGQGRRHRRRRHRGQPRSPPTRSGRSRPSPACPCTVFGDRRCRSAR